LAPALRLAVESDMTNRWRVGYLVAGTLAVGVAPAMAQGPMQAPRTYECAANAHCSVDCQVERRQTNADRRPEDGHHHAG